MSRYYKINRFNYYLLGLLLIPFLLLCWHTLHQNYLGFDVKIFEQLASHRAGWLDFFFISLYSVSNTYVTGSIVLAALITLVKQRYWPEVKALVFATLGILLLVDQVLKPFFNRDRPPSPRLVTHLSPDSFPSGHASGNLVFYFFMSAVIAARYPQLKPYVYAFSSLIVLLIGFGSIYVKAHWLTDILAGYVFGYIWLVCSLKLLMLLTKKNQANVSSFKEW